MSDLIQALVFPFLAAFGLAATLLSLQLIVLAPLTLVYEVWKRRTLRSLSLKPFRGGVSVIVPAYNEEKSLRACLESILAAGDPGLDVIVVNDGSTDETEKSIRELIDGGRIRYFYQSNAGKAAALNRGAAQASGEVLVFTDADSLFLPDTVQRMTRWFADPRIDAVCGNDEPLVAGTPLQRLLSVTTHIGTGFVRRALSVAGVLPIITGNLGAVRAAVFRDLGGFRPIWGEDLDLTFRLRRAGRRIIFDPDAVVRSECPASLGPLWRQRIRWVRSYLKITRMHRDLFLPAKAPPFSLYLPVNYFSQVVVPVLQLLSLPLFFRIAYESGTGIAYGFSLLFYLGLLTFLAVGTYSILLDRDWKALRHLPAAALLIVPISYFYNFVVLTSVWREIRGRSERWDRIERAPAGPAGRWGGWTLAAAGTLILGLALGPQLAARLDFFGPGPAPDFVRAAYARGGEIALATHFDGWRNWRQAVRSVLQNPDARGIGTVGLGAGRPEWTYFRWEGHKEAWSSTQSSESADLLDEAVRTFQERGLKTVAILDLYAPALIGREPAKAAVRFDGMKSDVQVEFMELVEGEYGKRVVEMARYLARHYPVEAVALTELSYKSFCYDDRCLRSYRGATGRPEWPLSRNQTVDTDHLSIGEWRSELMEGFLRRVAAAVHAEGKRLYVDVPVSWGNLFLHGKDSGLDYTRVLRHADRMVVWNYFNLEHLDPEISRALAEDLRRNFPADRIFVSIGLWEKQGVLDPGAFEQALDFTIQGGISNLWITPNHLMAPAHWEALTAVLGKPGE